MKTLVIMIAALFVLSGCGPDQRIIESAKQKRAEDEAIMANANAASSASSFDQDLEAMRNADFNFIYVFRRKDGRTLDGDDKRFLSETVPPEVNRRRLADDEKALIIGSNFRLPPNVMKTLKDRFTFEDFSKPVSDVANTDSGSTPSQDDRR